MTTLTITDAKKNLGKWLQAASRGEDVAIISGADIIALRKIRVQPADYAMTEYGATREDVAKLTKKVDREYQMLKKAGKLKPMPLRELHTKLGL